MSAEPVPADPGRDESVLGWEPVITRPDPVSAEERQAWLECDLDEGPDPEEVQYEEDFLNSDADLTEAELAEIAEAMEARAAAALGAAAGTDSAEVAPVLAAQAAAGADPAGVACSPSPAAWTPSSPAPRPHSGTASSRSPRRRSSLMPSRC